jgi:membrane protein
VSAVAGKKNDKRANKKKRSVVETVLVPAAATAIVTSAVVHARSEHDGDRHNGHARNGHRSGNGDGSRPGEVRHGSSPEDSPSFLDKVAKKLPFLKPVAAVQRRYGDVGGNHLAAALTLQAFLSIFPLLLVAIAVLGFVAAGSQTDVAGRLVENLGLKGESAKMVTDAVGSAKSSRKAASVVGLVGLLWSGLGLVGALQYAYNSVWQVNDRGMKDKAFGLLWLVGAALLFVGGAAATTVLRWLPGPVAPLAILVAFAVSFGLWLWTSRVLPNTNLPWKALVPGALVGAIGLEILKIAGAYYVPKAVASSSQLYGSLGIVFAVLAWLLLFGRLVVYSAVLNVVRYEKHQGTLRAVIDAPPVPDVRPVANRSGRLVAAEN